MTDTHRCENLRVGTTRKFTIANEDKVVLELSYNARDRDNDPSFDVADLEQEDFFFFTSRLWSDANWQAELVKIWDSEARSHDQQH